MDCTSTVPRTPHENEPDEEDEDIDLGFVPLPGGAAKTAADKGKASPSLMGKKPVIKEPDLFEGDKQKTKGWVRNMNAYLRDLTRRGSITSDDELLCPY